MSTACRALHTLSNQWQIHSFPFDLGLIPNDGIYVLFEAGESGHGLKRIVRIGTHTGTGQLRSRLKQHFINENKDRSIFRKHIGRALLNRQNDSFIDDWDLDLTTTAQKREHAGRIDLVKQKAVETQVTAYMQADFSLAVFRVGTKQQRLHLESRMISTVSHCEQCRPSSGWLGQFSPNSKIRESGLWQINELRKTPFSNIEFEEFAASFGAA